jgi:ATP-dependent Zn protease
MINRDQMGAAYHEAGHAVVAWALGLKVGRLAIAIGGDDAKGSADIEHDQEYPLVDRIALCVAGIDAKELFEAPTHENAGWGDHGKVYELLDGFDEDAGYALRCSGYQKARELLTMHKDKVDLLAKVLMDLREIDQETVADLLARCSPPPRPAL